MVSIPITSSLISKKLSTSSRRDGSKHKKSSSGSHSGLTAVPSIAPSTDSHGEKLSLVTATDGPKHQPGLNTGPPKRPERPADTLSIMLGHDLSVRRSKCGVEFLEEVARGGSSSAEAFRELRRKFEIVTGADAVAFYKKFVGSSSLNSVDAKENEEGEDVSTQSPVVFAITVMGAGRRLVDYYMTWRGRTRVNDIKGRKRSFLDSEFRKVARSLDKEFKRASIYGPSTAPTISAAGSIMAVKENAGIESPTTPQDTKLASRPLSVLIPPPVLTADSPNAPPSATDSVMSLPFLNMIRGVPTSHRIPLRITNPDRLSMISNIELETQGPQQSSMPLPTVKENENEGEREIENLAIISPGKNQVEAPQVIRVNNGSVRSAHSKNSAKSSAVSTTSSESIRSSKRKRRKESPEFVIVLLDDKLDKSSRTWHGLERQVSRSATLATLRRVSPWDGPLARDNGITYRTGPVKPSPSEGDESSSEEEWENAPVIPLKPYVVAAFSATSSSEPPTRHATPAPGMVPGATQYGLSMMGNMTPMVSAVNIAPYGYGIPSNPSPYINSPYSPAYASPYHTPNNNDVILLPPLSRQPYTGYQSPYMP